MFRKRARPNGTWLGAYPHPGHYWSKGASSQWKGMLKENKNEIVNKSDLETFNLLFNYTLPS